MAYRVRGGREEGGKTTKAWTKHSTGTNLDPPFREATPTLHNTLLKMSRCSRQRKETSVIDKRVIDSHD